MDLKAISLTALRNLRYKVICEISRRDAAIAAKKNASLVGKAFVYRNCGSGAKTEADYGNRYRLVTKVERGGNGVHVLQFQEPNGDVTTQIAECIAYPHSLGTEIPVEEFHAAAKEMLARITRKLLPKGERS